MSELVSVIIPIYNADKYLDKCIKSILNQTYKNLEIILIDDGSTDDSGSIVDRFAKNDNRIIVKHIENSGVSNARNIGLSLVTGMFVCFIDSDDYIDEKMIEKLYESIKKHKTDIAVCNIQFENENATIIRESHYNQGVLDKKEFIKGIFYNFSIHGYCANKLYSMEVIQKNGVQFNKNIFVLEDDLFNIEICCKTNSLKVSYIDESLYHYVSHTDSISNTSYSIKKLSYFNARALEIDMLESINIDTNYLKVDYCAAFTRAKILMSKNNIKKNNEFDIYNKLYKEYKNQITLRNLNKNLKTKYFVVKYLPFIYKIKIKFEK